MRLWIRLGWLRFGVCTESDRGGTFYHEPKRIFLFFPFQLHVFSFTFQLPEFWYSASPWVQSFLSQLVLMLGLGRAVPPHKFPSLIPHEFPF
jgi:hypothetical protein